MTRAELDKLQGNDTPLRDSVKSIASELQRRFGGYISRASLYESSHPFESKKIGEGAVGEYLQCCSVKTVRVLRRIKKESAGTDTMDAESLAMEPKDYKDLKSVIDRLNIIAGKL